MALKTIQGVWGNGLEVISAMFRFGDFAEVIEVPEEYNFPEIPPLEPIAPITPELDSSLTETENEAIRIAAFWALVLHNRDEFETFYQQHRTNPDYDLFRSTTRMKDKEIDAFQKSLENILLDKIRNGERNITLSTDYSYISKELEEAFEISSPIKSSAGMKVAAYLPNKAEMSLRQGIAYGHLGYDSPRGDPADLISLFNSPSPAAWGKEASEGAKFIIKTILDRDRLEKSGKTIGMDLYERGWMPRISNNQMQILEEALTFGIQEQLPYTTIVGRGDDHYSILNKAFEKAGLPSELIPQILPTGFLLVVEPGEVKGLVTAGEPLLDVTGESTWKLNKGTIRPNQPFPSEALVAIPINPDNSLEGLEAHAAARWYTDLLRNQALISKDPEVNERVSVFEHHDESSLTPKQIDNFEENLRYKIREMMQKQAREGVANPVVKLFCDYEVSPELHEVACQCLVDPRLPAPSPEGWSGVLPVKTGITVSKGHIDFRLGAINNKLTLKDIEHQKHREIAF